MQSVFMSLNVK